MTKVLIAGVGDNLGGVEAVVLNYCQALDKTDLQLDFLCNRPTIVKATEIAAFGGQVFFVGSARRMWEYRRNVQRVLATGHYDVVWVNRCDLANITLLKLAKKMGIPKIIIHSHNSGLFDQGKLRPLKLWLHWWHKQRIARWATDFWSCSLAASQWFFPKAVINSPRHRIIYNALAVEDYAFDAAARVAVRQELGLPLDAWVVGNVGRLTAQKNQTLVLQVFQEIVAREPKARLLLVGQGEDETKLRQQVAALGLTAQVLFLGMRADVPRLLSAMDVFLFPSLFEGFGLAAVEAQASGLPVVMSDQIPAEVKILPTTQVLALTDPVTTWAAACGNTETKVEARAAAMAVVQKTPFAVTTAVGELHRLLTQQENNVQ